MRNSMSVVSVVLFSCAELASFSAEVLDAKTVGGRMVVAGDLNLSMCFDVGDYRVNLFPSRENVGPTVTFSDRTFTFAYRTDGWLQDGDKQVDYHSSETNALAVLKNTARGVRADYVHSLYTGDGAARRLVGICSNEVVFSEGIIGVRATLYPSESGRYRFYRSQKAAQVVIFPDYARRWVGTTLWMSVSKELSYFNELQPHEQFDPKAWGMNGNQIGPSREMVFGNVPDVISFKGSGDTRFTCNRYQDGFEAGAFCLNDDEMHKPFWNGPIRFSYFIKLEK